jgi:hypothetical protein
MIASVDMQAFLLQIWLFLTVVNAHGDSLGINLMGTGAGKMMRDLKSRNVFGKHQPFTSDEVAARGVYGPEPAAHLQERQTPATCGPGIGNCSAGYCCSIDKFVTLSRLKLHY